MILEFHQATAVRWNEIGCMIRLGMTNNSQKIKLDNRRSVNKNINHPARFFSLQSEGSSEVVRRMPSNVTFLFSDFAHSSVVLERTSTHPAVCFKTGTESDALTFTRSSVAC